MDKSKCPCVVETSRDLGDARGLVWCGCRACEGTGYMKEEVIRSMEKRISVLAAERHNGKLFESLPTGQKNDILADVWNSYQRGEDKYW